MTAEKRTPGGNRANAKQSAGTAQNEYTATPSRIASSGRLAPYARAVLDLLRAGKNPNVYLFAGSDAWSQAEYRRRTHGEGSILALPPGDYPRAYRWPALDALVAIPGDCDGERFRALVRSLLLTGCRCVVEVRHGQAPTCHYADKRDALEVAA